MKFKLETGIPVQGIRRNLHSRSEALRNTIKAMGQRQSFIFPSPTGALSDLYTAAKAVGKKVMARKVGKNHYRVWLQPTTASKTGVKR